jgi:threonine dehydrogenase-like Zn-dependent dehydrogenase
VYAKLNHATNAVVDTNTQFCVRVPDELDSTTASFVRMGNVAISALQRASVKMGDSVAVIGLGLVGNLAGQFFRISGQRVIGVDLAAHRRELALQTGFHAAVAPGDSLTDELKAANFGLMPKVVVEAVGDSRLVEQGIKLVANNGQVILLGSPRATYETNCTPMLSMTHLRGISLVGALEWTIPLLKKQSPGNTTESNAELILRLIASGDLNVKPLLSHVLPPSELNNAYQGLLHNKDAYLGVVIDWENHSPPIPDWGRD